MKSIKFICLIVMGIVFGSDVAYKIYDKNYKILMRIEGHRIYSKDYKRVGYIEGNRIYDRKFRRKGVITEGKEFKRFQGDLKKK